MGFARCEGRAVFVPRTAVGDQCDVRIVKVTKNVAFGRVEDYCAVGTCVLRLRVRWRISAAALLLSSTSPTRKNCVRGEKVRDALTHWRSGRRKAAWHYGCADDGHYRNKAQYPGRTGTKKAALLPALPSRSHDIVPGGKCLIGQTADKIAAVVREWMTEIFGHAVRL